MGADTVRNGSLVKYINIPALSPQLNQGEAEELGGMVGFWINVKAEPTGFADGLDAGWGEGAQSRGLPMFGA